MRRRRLISREGGFTLIELLVSMTIGMIVIFAAFTILDRAFKANAEVSDRADGLQRGRNAMELITRQLRSEICLGQAKDPIVTGQDNSITFYVDMTDGRGVSQPGDGFTNPERHTITYSPATKDITESDWAGAGSYPDLTFPAETRSSTILQSMTAAQNGATTLPLFRYYAFDEATGAAPGAMVPLATPLTTADVARTVMIKVAFRALANRAGTPRLRDATQLENDVYVRIADPTDPEDGPRCR